MRLVLCGSPDFAVPTLRAVLAAGHDVALVLSQPDRPAGRKLEVQAPAVAQAARQLGLSLLQPGKIKNNEELRAALLQIEPDAILVVAYGRIIPGWMLDLPRFGNINLHGSLLPKYRGAAPIQWAVANGEQETGVTTMRLDEGLDTGNVLLERRVTIEPETTAAMLFERLAEVGASLVVETLAGLASGELTGRPQDGSLASHAPILTRDDGLMRLAVRPAQHVYNRWRGFSPWPGAWAILRGKRFLVHRMSMSTQETEGAAPGDLIVADDHLFGVAADGGALLFDEVQLEGKSRMSGGQFARDFQLVTGERLD